MGLSPQTRQAEAPVGVAAQLSGTSLFETGGSGLTEREREQFRVASCRYLRSIETKMGILRVSPRDT